LPNALPPLDWDSLRFALAVGRAGTLVAAASALRLSQSTVFRRLNGLERDLGARLFDRTAQPFRPTQAGEAFLRVAEQMERDLSMLERGLRRWGERPGGTLRITATDTLAHGLLGGYLTEFLAEHPAVTVELITENRFLDLPRREADIAFRPARTGDADLVGRRLSSVSWAFFAAPSYLQQNDTSALDAHRFVGWDEATDHIQVVRFMREHGLADRVIYRSNSLLHQMSAARHGIGVAALPCFLADREAGLRRVTPPVPQLRREIWVLTRRDLRDVPHVRAFLDFIGSAIARDRALLEGEMTLA
jgi:DNA-binding transcriptional LysR family regulator